LQNGGTKTMKGVLTPHPHQRAITVAGGHKERAIAAALSAAVSNRVRRGPPTLSS